MTGLYIHVPFCVAPCAYCDFYKAASAEKVDQARYIRALAQELRRLPASFSPETVFVGGGTPTSLPVDLLDLFYEQLLGGIDFSKVSEFSTEANPGTLSEDKLKVLLDAGVNRVSMGVQSFNNDALRLLGRIHDRQEAIASYELLRKTGFENVNIDLIQSVPGMTCAMLEKDMQTVIDLAPEHISSYNLIYEPGTILAEELDSGRIVAPDEEIEAETYFNIKEQLEQAGYVHYEISNFSRVGKECQHNLLYWQGGEYFGCGPSAHSHWGGARFGNVPNLKTYCDRIECGENPFDEVERLAPEIKARELLVMRLRLVRGVELEAFFEQTGFQVEDLCGEAIRDFEEEGLLVCKNGRLFLHSDAFFISNGVLSELV